MPLMALPTAFAPIFAPRPAVWTASTAACAPVSSLLPGHLAAPSSADEAWVIEVVASLPAFCSCSAVACQAVASAWSALANAFFKSSGDFTAPFLTFALSRSRSSAAFFTPAEAFLATFFSCVCR